MRSALAIAILGALSIACGDDDPAAVDNPCDDANTSCLNLELTPDQMSYAGSFDPSENWTIHTVSWNLGSTVLSSYGPGRRIIINVNFDPSIDARYDHFSHGFALFAGPGGTFDKSATPPLTSYSTDWVRLQASATCQGHSINSASRFQVAVLYGPLEAGDRLKALRFDVTIPATYDNGVPVLAGDVGPMSVFVSATITGNSEGNPPAWPRGLPVGIVSADQVNDASLPRR